MKALANEIINGRRLCREDDLHALLDADPDELCAGADAIRQAFFQNRVSLCTIINGRSGRCSEDCKFCAQSAHHTANCEVYELLDAGTVLADCKKREAAGVHRYSIVTAGRTVQGRELDRLVEIYRLLHESCRIGLCASHGLLTAEAFRRLREAGVTRYHCNIETSRRYFPFICTTHTFDDKLREIRLAKEAGLEICSGGIIGMGETWEDRIDMALCLSELSVCSIPLNALIPLPGTPLGDRPRLTEEEILRTVALFRYINPEAEIRMAAGRNYFPDGGRRLFRSGLSAVLTGDMLTTVGNNTAQDKEMLASLGFQF